MKPNGRRRRWAAVWLGVVCLGLAACLYISYQAWAVPPQSLNYGLPSPSQVDLRR